MKFLLIKPGERKTKDIFSIYEPTIHPPLGLLYLGGVLEQEGHEVEVIDYNMENVTRDQLRNVLTSSDAVGMTIYSNDYKSAQNISSMIKEIDPNIPLVIGGPHCTFIQGHSLNDIPDADISVIGEGEYVILDLVKYLQGNKKLADIHGVYYRDNGSIRSGKTLQIIENLDDLPVPARHLVDKYDYGNYPFGYHLKKKVTALLTSKGCPFHCRFCSRYSNVIKEWGFRQRSVENVVKEIQELDEKYRSIRIDDDSFLADRNRAHKIFDNLLEIGTNLDLLIEGARVDSADRDLYEKMKKTGVTLISYGIESGNQDVLDFYNKKTTLQQIRKAINLAREMNFFTSASFILGAPIETKQHIDNTIKFACSLPLDIASFGPLGYIRGSQLWIEAVESNKISKESLIVLADKDKDLGNFTREELIEYVLQSYKTFYLRPGYLLRQIYRCMSRNDYSLLFNGVKYLFSLNNIGPRNK